MAGMKSRPALLEQWRVNWFRYLQDIKLFKIPMYNFIQWSIAVIFGFFFWSAKDETKCLLGNHSMNWTLSSVLLGFAFMPLMPPSTLHQILTLPISVQRWTK